MKKIIIDPGHGGKDSGAVGFGVLEKNWNLKISLYQYKRLKELGAQVALTRSSEQTLESYNRVSKIKNKYDICLSNHWNAFNGSARGVETIHSYLAEPDFAKKIAQAIVGASGLPLRRVFSRKTANGRSDYYFMHRLTGSTRTVIIEYGFIDNKADHHFYKNEENFYRVAEAVVKVVCEEIGISYKLPGQGGLKRADDSQRTGSKDAGDSRSSKARVATSPAGSNQAYNGKRLTSIHSGKLRFYKRPSWADRDVYGYLKKGQGFVRVLDRVKVGRAYQYKVSNSKGEVYYVTASPKFVKVH